MTLFAQNYFYPQMFPMMGGNCFCNCNASNSFVNILGMTLGTTLPFLMAGLMNSSRTNYYPNTQTYSTGGASRRSYANTTETTSPTTQTRTNPSNTGAKTNNSKTEVAKILKDAGLKVSDAQLQKLVEKYNVLLEKDPNATSDYLALRIKNYAKAFNAHDTELEMGEKFKNGVKDTECNLKIVDNDIKNAKANPASQEFLDSLLNRGQGYLDLYDENNDGKISFDEFKNFEEADFGEKLSSEQIAATKEYFDKMDKNHDNGIDAVEMACHRYAMARITDSNNGDSTTEDITYGEWLGTQMMDEDPKLAKWYDYASNQLYDALKKD